MQTWGEATGNMSVHLQKNKVLLQKNRALFLEKDFDLTDLQVCNDFFSRWSFSQMYLRIHESWHSRESDLSRI